MRIRASALVLSTRPHGETAVLSRLFTEDHGVIVAYIAGGRGRLMRPALISGNEVMADLRSQSDGQLPFARIELLSSVGPWLSEPLPAAALGWVTALTATTLPERNPYPVLYRALGAVQNAIRNANSARQWVRGVISYEALMLRELGYGGNMPDDEAQLDALLEIFARQGDQIERYLLADRRGDVMAARERLIQRLERMQA